jgi:hypothetical protein
MRIKGRTIAKRASGISQQMASDAVRTAQRIDRGELQPDGPHQHK